VIEGSCYALSSSACDHRRFSDHRILGPAAAVFANGAEAVSAEAARAATDPS
jgi:hypothetical protein